MIYTRNSEKGFLFSFFLYKQMFGRRKESENKVGFLQLFVKTKNVFSNQTEPEENLKYPGHEICITCIFIFYIYKVVQYKLGEGYSPFRALV